MMTRQTIVGLAMGVFTFCAASLASAQTASVLKAIANDAGGVHVVVKPKNIAAGSPWEFDVTMDTHIKPLDADLTKSAALVDSGGHRYAATAWQGDPPGGHHRKGVLRFPALETKTGAFEIQIENVGGTGKRVFQWTIK